MTQSEERELIEQCKTDPLAFGKVFDDHFEAIFQYTLHRVGNVAVAQDLTAQTFYNALNSLWKFRWTGVSISSWLYRIATNEINGFFRKLKRRPETDIEQVGNYLKDHRFQPDREMEQAENAVARCNTFNRLNESIRQLDPDEQTLLTLRYFENLSYADIAQIMGKKEGTLRMRCKRILEKLHGHLNSQGVNYERFRTDFMESPEAASQPEFISTKPAPGLA